MAGGPRILIVGGGYGGMHTALRLERLLHPGEATVTVADPRSYMTYQPLLAEAAAGNLEPRHVVIPLRGVLHRTQVIKAAVSSVDHQRQLAYRQAARLAGNIAAVLRGREPRPYWHASAGSVASLGLHQGVAEIYGLRMHGFPAWMTHRTYHLLRLPTLNRRLHMVSDWTLALPFSRDIVSLDVLEPPRQDFQAALDLIASGPPPVMVFTGAKGAGIADREDSKEGDAVRDARRRQAEGVPPGRAASADAAQAEPGGTRPGMSGPGSTDGWARVCPLEKLREDQPLHADISRCPVCVIRSNGTVYALRDECTHEAVPLSDGEVADGAIECWKHGSRFDLATGRALSRPATKPVDVYPVQIDGDDVLVRLDVP